MLAKCLSNAQHKLKIIYKICSEMSSGGSTQNDDVIKSKPKLDERKSAPNANAKPAANRDDRNFRSHYYEKVGFRGMDERKTLDTILKDDPISLEKCANFALRCNIPAVDRLFLWKILLGEEAIYPINRKDFNRWKERTYQDCKRLLKSSARLDDSWQMSKTLTIMWLLYEDKLNLDFDTQLKEEFSQNFSTIVTSTLAITSSNEIEAFFLAKGLAKILNKHSEEVYEELIQIYHKLLSTDQNALYSHLEKIGLNEEIPLRSWFLRGFAGVLRGSALVDKLWDKLVCGAVKLLPFIAVALVEVKKTQLMGCQTAKEAIRLLTSVEDADQNIIASKGIELWTLEGSALLPQVESNVSRRIHRVDLPKSGKEAEIVNDRPPPILPVPKFPMVYLIQIDMSVGSIIEEEC